MRAGWTSIFSFDGLLMSVFGGVMLTLLVASVHDARTMRDLDVSTRAALQDTDFRARVVQAGYRIEEHKSKDVNTSWIIARCARSTERGPLPCDPAPRPDGLAGEAMVVIP